MKNAYSIFFSNLSSPLRVSIITALKEHEAYVGELSKKLKTEQSKLSHALSGLKKCNLVSSKREGKNKVYSINKKTLLPILKIIDVHSKENCGGNCGDCIACE